MEEYKVFYEAPSRKEFLPYFITLIGALSGIDGKGMDFAIRGHLFDNLIDYSIVNKKFLTGEEKTMMQKFFQHTVAHTAHMEKKHNELFDKPWIEKKVTSIDLREFFRKSLASEAW
uniref:Uncharacterized protein n=1 Tax=Marseillevirus LCMAC101 TaxID=2506602 RepID=A0A481YSM6_9VIRU|nr:MAG: hypothetical protein LCMAC101_00730 [Marseillevirus LCMAC101]